MTFFFHNRIIIRAIIYYVTLFIVNIIFNCLYFVKQHNKRMPFLIPIMAKELFLLYMYYFTFNVICNMNNNYTVTKLVKFKSPKPPIDNAAGFCDFIIIINNAFWFITVNLYHFVQYIVEGNFSAYMLCKNVFNFTYIFWWQ